MEKDHLNELKAQLKKVIPEGSWDIRYSIDYLFEHIDNLELRAEKAEKEAGRMRDALNEIPHLIDSGRSNDARVLIWNALELWNRPRPQEYRESSINQGVAINTDTGLKDNLSTEMEV